MDNHPIPQDVTGFQFRLIGNMTVKQFAYVAIGVVGAVLLYYIPLFIIIKILFIPLFIIGGVALAFMPIEGRPIDIMASHFLKALFAPTQFIYQRNGGHLLLSSLAAPTKAVSQAATQNQNAGTKPASNASREAGRQQQLASYLETLHRTAPQDTKDADRFTALFQQANQLPQAPQMQASAVQPATTSQPAPQSPSAPVPNDQATSDEQQITQDDAMIQQVNQELSMAKAAEQNAVSPTAEQTAHVKVVDFETKLKEIISAKQKLETELAALKTAQAQQLITEPVATVPTTPAPVSASAPAAPQPAQTQPATPPAPTTHALPSADASKAGLPSVPDHPNILIGIVKDSSGNVLPNVLVEVKDSEDNPVRAFKTNQLGQFASATPLANGTYHISFEDPKGKVTFDVVQLVVKGEILSPIEVFAHDLREELRKSLFA